MLRIQNKDELQTSKNLLAFSAGGDSTALFFLLLENNIQFDIAIVDYEIRTQSKEEVAYARELAHKYKIKCFVHTVEQINTNFEANAREARYDFFEQLIDEHHYEILLTAHHLGDRFEWMLMQFCKGAGCAEISGMKNRDKRSNYTLLRPLLHLDKKELLEYLNERDIPYFDDASNSDTKYKRNEFRLHHAAPLLEKYKSGIKQSFDYIDEDVEELIKDIKVTTLNRLAYFKNSHSKRSNIYAIDKYLKSQKQIITANERALLKENDSVVLGRKRVVCSVKDYIFIAPYIQMQQMDKAFKEKMRILQIDPKLRGYLSTDAEVEVLVSLLLQ